MSNVNTLVRSSAAKATVLALLNRLGNISEYNGAAVVATDRIAIRGNQTSGLRKASPTTPSLKALAAVKRDEIVWLSRRGVEGLLGEKVLRVVSSAPKGVETAFGVSGSTVYFEWQMDNAVIADGVVTL